MSKWVRGIKASKMAMNQGKETWPEKLGIERGLSGNLRMKWCFFLYPYITIASLSG